MNMIRQQTDALDEEMMNRSVVRALKMIVE